MSDADGLSCYEAKDEDDVFSRLDREGPPEWWRGKAAHWPSLERRRQIEKDKAKRRKEQTLSRWYFRLSWYDLAKDMRLLATDKATRLLFVVRWQTRVEKPRGGWVLPKQQLLDALELSGKHHHRAVDRLERLGMVEVQRRSGKRPLLRFIDGPGLRLIEKEAEPE
jgi:hypothetical protein